MRSLFPALLAVLIGCAGPSDGQKKGLKPEIVDDSPFTVVVLPDIQYLTLNPEGEVFRNMMDWILEHREALNIQMVLQEGDITHNNTEAEWVEADAGFSMLDGLVPYIVCVGNHDMDGNDADARDTTRYNQWFGLDRIEKSETFFASAAEDNADDHAHIFSAGGVDWMLISLAYDPTNKALNWAKGLLEDNPNRVAIILTHAYLLPSGTTGPQGENIQRKLVDKFSNVRFVINGHYTDGTNANRRRERNDGSEVLEIFANYQTMTVSAGGRMRQMWMDPVAGVVDVTSCNAWDVCSEEEGDTLLFEDLVFAE